MQRRIYFDNSATTAVDPDVIAAMLPYFTQEFGNASSIHTYGQTAKAALDRARRQVAGLIGAGSNEIVFVSGGTEADNLAIRGIAAAFGSYGRHIITSQIEHPAVINTCNELEKSGFRVTYLPVNERGLVEIESVSAALSEDTILISIMLANNEIGTVQPLAEIAELVREVRQTRRHIYLHTDAVQAAGRIPINVAELGVDLLSLSGHKIYAPKGVGALYVRRGIRLKSQMFGGHHERDRRAGTENVPSIVGLGHAAEQAREHLAKWQDQLSELRDYLEQGIVARIPHVVLNGDRSRRLPNISSVSFRFVEGEGLLISLDLKGIAVSTGSACSSGSLGPSPVLLAIGLSDELAHGTLRFSLGKNNTRDEVDYTLSVLPEIVERLRHMSPMYQTEAVV